MSCASQNARPRLLPLGPDGVLVRFSERLSEPANRAALAFRAAVAATGIEGVTELASSLTSVLVRFHPGTIARADLCARLEAVLAAGDWSDPPLPAGRRLWRIPAAFGGADGPDLAEVAAAAGLSEQDAVAELCATPLRVLALGFAPGQPYLGFLPPNWDIPRRSDVTAEVPAGAVVVAVRQVIPFTNASPTGWHRIGRTAFRCFDADREPPIVFAPGDEVVFTPVQAGELEQLAADPARLGGARSESLG